MPYTSVWAGRINAVYPNGDGARFFGTFTARYPEWVWRYYLSTGDKATALANHRPASMCAASCNIALANSPIR